MAERKIASHWGWDTLLLVLFLGFFPYSLYYALVVPNVILEQGLSHRIFYFHVPVAWVALYAPLFSSVSAVLYLITRDARYDTLGFSLNQIALLFSLGVLVSGPIWAKSAWGVSWDWTDARLQSFFVLCLSLAGYFLLRSLIIEPNKKYFVSACLSLLCAANSILTWGAIRWFENPGNHPGSVLGEGGMDPDMRVAFYLNVLSYHFLFLLLIRLSYRLQKIKFSFGEWKSKEPDF